MVSPLTEPITTIAPRPAAFMPSITARAALRLGSGRVYVGLLDTNAPVVDPMQLELMLRTPENLLTTELSVLACGPGLGLTRMAEELLSAACMKAVPLVLDAYALTLVAGSGSLSAALDMTSTGRRWMATC